MDGRRGKGFDLWGEVDRRTGIGEQCVVECTEVKACASCVCTGEPGRAW